MLAFDEELANRVRVVLGDLDRCARDRQMFGGMAFMVDGNMAAAGVDTHDDLAAWVDRGVDVATRLSGT